MSTSNTTSCGCPDMFTTPSISGDITKVRLPSSCRTQPVATRRAVLSMGFMPGLDRYPAGRPCARTGTAVGHRMSCFTSDLRHECESQYQRGIVEHRDAGDPVAARVEYRYAKGPPMQVRRDGGLAIR